MNHLGRVARLLIVEDEPAIAESLAFVLRADGHEVLWRQRAGEALQVLREEGVDLAILDVGLPDLSGFELCKAVRRFSEVPVMFLTARADEVDRVVGLEIGADDYVVKPFSPREVAARVRAILKRLRAPAAAQPAPGALHVDAEKRQVVFRGQVLPLTPAEYRLCEYLLARPGRVCSREELLDALGIARNAGYERSVDGHVRDLRAKLREVAPDADPIQTHRGFGYSFQPARC